MGEEPPYIMGTDGFVHHHNLSWLQGESQQALPVEVSNTREVVTPSTAIEGPIPPPRRLVSSVVFLARFLGISKKAL